ncbi:MAG: AAA family ATPase, partial [Candidatus Micrarchaeota archaeon]
MIFGIAGKNCAGKDTVADYLKSKGFEYLSLSDAIRDELAQKKIEPTRENLIRAGTQIREKYGSGELARRIAKKVSPGKNYAIVSIRNPQEVRELEKLDGFFMVEVRASEKLRFGRMKSRARAGDPQALGQFIAAEKAEAASKNSAAQ